MKDPAGAMRSLYVFLDEGGNMDFSASGTRHFVLSAITKERPFNAYREITELKYDLVENGVGVEYFHAAEDRQVTRNQVFKIIGAHLEGVRADSLIVDKRKTPPEVRHEERFYPEMLGRLIGKILKEVDLSRYVQLIIYTDSIPVQRKRQAVEKAVKRILARQLPSGLRYRIHHHASKSNIDLQIADYINWAVYRKWEQGDQRSHLLIKQVIQSEVAVFDEGGWNYY
jgi:hypothetical protein